jgi:hypothetical protein
MLVILKSESLNLLEPSWPFQACNGIALSLPIFVCSFSSGLWMLVDVWLWAFLLINEIYRMSWIIVVIFLYVHAAILWKMEQQKGVKNWLLNFHKALLWCEYFFITLKWQFFFVTGCRMLPCSVLKFADIKCLWEVLTCNSRLGLHSQYSDSLRAGQSGDRILVGARYSTLVQNGP